MTSTKGSAHSAPGQYQGYTLQDVRLAYHLLSSPPGSSVAIEHIDDVSVHYPDGRELSEQTKSALKSNPLGDHAPDLWKTLANWGQYVPPTGSGPRRQFQLYVVPEKSGAIASHIHAAKSDADADKVIDMAGAIMESGAAATLKKQLQRFLSLPIRQQRYVITNSNVVTACDEYEPIRKCIGAGISISIELANSACRYIIGKAQTDARQKISAKLSAVLDADAFKAELQAFISRTNMQRLLPSASALPEDLVSAKASTRPYFIRQLELVNANEITQLRATADYLQAAATRTQWSADGIALHSSFDRWDKSLVTAHLSIRDVISIEHKGKSSEDRGHLLMSKCCLHKEKFDANDVGQEFVIGSFHDLAERKRLGWHDDFTTLLGDE